MSDSDLKDRLKKISVAPRVTMEDFQDNIKAVNFFTGRDGVNGHLGIKVEPNGSPLDLLTICIITLQNGFTCLGTSACVSPENFNEEIGKKIARKKAEEQIWPLMGYYHLAQQKFQSDMKEV